MITLKERVLHKGQEKIFSLYFEITIEEINWSTQSNQNKLLNPLRGEGNASLSFKWFGNKLYSRDWGNRNYSGDVFSIVGYIINKNPNFADDFIEICEDILNKFESKKVTIKNKFDYEIIEEDKCIYKIEYKERTLMKRDYLYFNSFYITNKYVNKYVHGVYRIDLNDKRTGYKNSNIDPCYAYTINRDYVKLYFPFRNRNSKYPRFITNNILPLEDITDLRYCSDIILCKSIKDKMLLLQMLDSIGITSIIILTVSSEANDIHPSILTLLKKHVKYNIFSMFDIDECGINQMNRYKQDYGFIPLYFNTDAKDPTDYSKKYGYNKAIQSFKENIVTIIKYRTEHEE